MWSKEPACYWMAASANSGPYGTVVWCANRKTQMFESHLPLGGGGLLFRPKIILPWAHARLSASLVSVLMNVQYVCDIH